jgi:hypothetical protein
MLNTNNPQHKGQGEGSKHHDQLSKVFQAFFESPKTRKEADKACGIMRENICWYVRYFRQHKQIAVIRKRYCAVTKHLAEELTTNPALFPKEPKQLDLWN